MAVSKCYNNKAGEKTIKITTTAKIQFQLTDEEEDDGIEGNKLNNVHFIFKWRWFCWAFLWY